MSKIGDLVTVTRTGKTGKIVNIVFMEESKTNMLELSFPGEYSTACFFESETEPGDKFGLYKLTAFRVTYDDGTSYETSMAPGVTLKEATDYLTQGPHVMSDEKTLKYVAKVEQIR